MVDAGPIQRLNAALEGRYRIERELGAGGMATVYLAEDLRHHRHVALKVLKPELAAVVGAERFLTEIETTANLTHPNILPLHDSGEAAGSIFFVMPYVEEETLRERLERDKQLPVEEAVRIAIEVADALEYAHRQGVIHRDIKPANILLKGGRPLVADFGIALAASRSGGGERLTETGMSLGTPYYMSPEQATGSQAVGRATDIYALGCVLYEMLVGEPPYTGSTPQAVLGKIITENAAPVTEARRTAPPNVAAAVSKAIEKLPADRFRTAEDFGRALQDPGFRWGTAVVGPAARETRRWKAVSAVLGAIALALAAVVALLPGPDGSAPVGARYFSIFLPPGGNPAPSAMSQPLAFSRVGDRVVYRPAMEDVGGAGIWARRLAERRWVPIVGTEGAGSFVLSPDGSALAFHHPVEGAIRRVSIDGGQPVTVADTDGEPFHGAAWGPDGTLVFALESGLRRVPAIGGAVERLTDVDPAEGTLHRHPAVLPDGSGVLFTLSPRTAVYPDQKQIAVLPFGGEVTPVVDGHSAQITPDGVLLFSQGRSGELWAARLSEDHASISQGPVRVLDSGPRYVERSARRYGVSVDGMLVYEASVGSGGAFELEWVDRSGRTETLLDMVDYPNIEGAVAGPRLSPDGTRLAFRAAFDRDPRYRIFVYDLEGRTLTPITLDVNADWPVWMPDGDRLVFNRFSSEHPEEQDMYVLRADGAGDPEPLIPPDPYQRHAQEFSPDGRFLVFQHSDYSRAGDVDIWLLPRDGGEPRPIVATPAFELHPSISPDGRWMAYRSGESGEPEIYVTDFPEARRRWRVSDGQNPYNPLWNPAGGELFYRVTEPTGGVVSVPVSSDTTFNAGVPRVLFTGSFRGSLRFTRSIEVNADGSRFILGPSRPQETLTPRIDVVENWMEEVHRRLKSQP